MPLATPLTPQEQLDINGLRQLLRHVVVGGVNNIFLLGSNGEFPAFDVAFLQSFVSTTRSILTELKAACPLLIGIGAPSLREAIKRGQAAVDAGADAVVACAPYYFIYNRDDLRHFFVRVADSLSCPVVMYNIPRYTNNPIDLELAATLAQHPNIVGIKDSSQDKAYFQGLLEIAAMQPRFAVSQGVVSQAHWAITIGAHGITPGIANIAPRACADLWSASKDPDRQEVAAKLQQWLLDLCAIYRIRSGVAGSKAALAELGICGATPAGPYQALSLTEREQVRAILRRAGLIAADVAGMS